MGSAIAVAKNRMGRPGSEGRSDHASFNSNIDTNASLNTTSNINASKKKKQGGSLVARIGFLGLGFSV